MTTWPPPADELIGEFITLSVFAQSDSAEVHEALYDEDVRRHLMLQPASPQEWMPAVTRVDETAIWPRVAWVARLNEPRRGLPAGAVAGTSSYYKVSVPQSHLSVGYTMFTKPVWGDVANAESKLLLIGYAIETLGFQRVELETDIRNTPAQRAMEGMGLVREGVLRRHKRRTDGSLRDTVIYSAIADEWPQVRAILTARIASRR